MQSVLITTKIASSNPVTPVFTTNKTGRHDKAEILLKVALNNINHKPTTKNKFVERGNIDTPNTQIHDRSLSWLDSGTSIKSGGVKCLMGTNLINKDKEKLRNYIEMKIAYDFPTGKNVISV